MRTLKELGFTFKQVKEVVTSFNNSEVAKDKITTVGVKGEALILDLINAIGALPDEAVSKVPADVQAFYDGLPDELFNQNVDPEDVAGEPEPEPEPAPAPATTKGKGKDKGGNKKEDAPVENTDEDDEAADVDTTHQSECPVYGKGWNPKEPECQTCNKDFHKDYVNCKKMVKNITATKKRTRSATSGEKKFSAKKSRYGHRLNTMAACVDDMVWAGAKYEDIVARIAQWHGKTESASKHAFAVHTKYLTATHGIAITVSNEGFVKAGSEYIEGRTAENTDVAVPSVLQK